MLKLLKSTLTVSAVALCVSLSPAQAEELTIEAALARGLVTNPEYGVVANNRRATDEEYRQAQGLFLPSIDLRASGGYG